MFDNTSEMVCTIPAATVLLFHQLFSISHGTVIAKHSLPSPNLSTKVNHTTKPPPQPYCSLGNKP